MKFFILFILLVSYLVVLCDCKIHQDDDDDYDIDEWKWFKNRHAKSYHTKDESERKRKWRHEKKNVQDHNQRFKRGEESFEMEVNFLADFTENELKALKGTIKLPEYENIDTKESQIIPKLSAALRVSLPVNFSWVSQKAVSAVQNQGKCGSCWSFASTGSLESRYFQKTGKLVSFSKQQLIDCNYDKTSGNWGCNGGDYRLAIKYWNKNGFQNNATYPYTGIRAKCGANLKKLNKDYKVSKSCAVFNTKNNEDLMKSVLYSKWPPAIAINVQDSLFSYKSGIYSDTNCKNDYLSLNHAVLLVGYGTENGKDYWLVKNSWGPYWGINGYFKIARNANNMCGVVTDPCFIDLI